MLKLRAKCLFSVQHIDSHYENASEKIDLHLPKQESLIKYIKEVSIALNSLQLWHLLPWSICKKKQIQGKSSP